MKKNKVLLQSLIFVALMGFGTRNVFAEDIHIDCNYVGGESEDGDCVVDPSKTAPLFGEYDDVYPPNYDLKPGDTVKRKITVKNSGSDTCYFTLDSILIKENHKDFAQELLTEFTGDSISSGQMSFWDLANGGTPLYLGALGPGVTKDFDWTVLFDINAGNEFQNARLVFDFTWTFSCVPRTQTRLLIEKTNDKMGITQKPGDGLKYTLTITAPDQPVFNVFVIDLPPGGFNYVGGSWTAYSSVRGDIKNSPTTAPTYFSPGTWILGNMAAGEIVTLTYDAYTDSDIESGLYKDLAWTYGTQTSSPSSTRVLGNVDTGIFVGTAAAVAIEEDAEPVTIEAEEKKIEIEEEEEGEVLGIAELPATGISSVWLKIVAVTFLAGVVLIMLSKFFHTKKTMSSVFLLGIFTSAFLRTANAQLLIRLEEPDSPNNQEEMNINFVVLDTDGGIPTVQCFMQGPNDSSFSQIGSDITLISSGDDGYCHIPESSLGDDGTYKFYASADSGSDTSLSGTVTVEHDSDRPGIPKYIEKDKKTSCTYEIKFKTADDGGDTDRAEVYRSPDKKFDANSSTKIRDFTVGSDEEVKFIDTKPNCGKSYYYAVRAFDDAGNGSRVRAETLYDEEIVVTTKKSESVFEQVLEALPSESGAVGADGTGGPIDADVVTEEEDGKISEEDGTVLGEQQEEDLPEEEETRRSWLPLFVLLLIMVYLYVTRPRNKDKQNQKKQDKK